MQNCDFLLAIGTRLAIPQVGYEISEFAREASIAVVDIDQTELEKYSNKFSHRICADAKWFLETAILLGSNIKPPESEDWIQACRIYRERFPNLGPEHADKDGFINSYAVVDKISDFIPPNGVVVTDMGTGLLSGHQAIRLKAGQRMMTSTGLGEMGFGLPAAIGASFARDCGPVLCLNCDGGMMMNLQELQTIAHHQLPIKIVIFNNDGYLMIKHTQRALFGNRYSGTNAKSGVTCPDFTKLAKAFNFPAFQVRTWEEFDKTIPEFFGAAGPAICEMFMHPEQPLVPKLSLAPQKDGSIISPPLEDLSPLLPRDVFRENMIIPVHPKSDKIES